MSRIFRVGDDIDTDALAPGRYMAAPLDTLAGHCLESVDPDFAGSVEPGDVLIAGRNFGMGSSREQAAQALKHLGLAGIVAHSFAGIFYRNAINLGLPVFAFSDPIDAEPGALGILDVDAATLTLPFGREAFFQMRDQSAVLDKPQKEIGKRFQI
ncbi:MAG: 3-isopropylmalate dehydratase [Pseudomonadota bacterium]